MFTRCPDEMELAGFVDGRLTSGEEHVLQHLAACSDCRSQVGLLTRLKREHNEFAIPPGWIAKARSIGEQRGLSARWLWGSALTGSIAAVVTIFLLARPSAPAVNRATVEPPSILAIQVPEVAQKGNELNRSQNPNQVRRAESANYLQIVSPKEDAEVRPGDEFVWRPVEGAIYYEVRILSAEGEVVWTSRSDTASSTLTSEPTIAVPGKSFLVIHAFLPDGRSVVSRAIAIRLAPRN